MHKNLFFSVRYWNIFKKY